MFKQSSVLKGALYAELIFIILNIVYLIAGPFSLYIIGPVAYSYIIFQIIKNWISYVFGVMLYQTPALIFICDSIGWIILGGFIGGLFSITKIFGQDSKKSERILLALSFLLIIFFIFSIFYQRHLINEAGKLNEAALQPSSIETCNKLSTGFQKDYCTIQIAIKEQDGTLCDLITSSGQKDSCFSQIGYKTMDLSLCNKIVEKGFIKNNCLSTVCAHMERGDTQDRCYLKLAIETKDEVMCSYISDFTRKDSLHSQCLQAIKK